MTTTVLHLVEKKTKHVTMAMVLTGAVSLDILTGGAVGHATSLVSLAVNIIWLMEE